MRPWATWPRKQRPPYEWKPKHASPRDTEVNLELSRRRRGSIEIANFPFWGFNHSTLKPVGLTVHDFKSLRFSDRLCSMAVSCLRLSLGLKDQRDPSIFTGLEVETKAIWNHLDVINPHVHLAPPSKNNNTDKRSIDGTIQFRYAVIAISMTKRAVVGAPPTTTGIQSGLCGPGDVLHLA